MLYKRKNDQVTISYLTPLDLKFMDPFQLLLESFLLFPLFLVDLSQIFLKLLSFFKFLFTY